MKHLNLKPKLSKEDTLKTIDEERTPNNRLSLNSMVPIISNFNLALKQPTAKQSFQQILKPAFPFEDLEKFKKTMQKPYSNKSSVQRCEDESIDSPS